MKTRIVSVGFFALCFYALQSVQAIPTPNNEVLDKGTSRICDELTESLTTAELEGPLGLVVKVVCPNLNRSPNSLDFKSSLETMSDEEFLSLLPTELSMFKYLVEQDYRNTLKKSSLNRAQKQDLLVTGYRPATVNNDVIQRYATQGQHLKEMKVLPDDNLPVPALQREEFPFSSFGFLASPKGFFVRPVPPLTESEFHKTGISLSSLGYVELIRTSPLLFFQRLTRHVESEAIIKRFYTRIQKVDFRQSYQKAMGSFADRYSLYFRDDLDKNGDNLGNYEKSVLYNNMAKFVDMVLYSMSFLPALMCYDKRQLDRYVKQIFDSTYLGSSQALLTLAGNFVGKVRPIRLRVRQLLPQGTDFHSSRSTSAARTHIPETKLFGDNLLQTTGGEIKVVTVNPLESSESANIGTTNE